MHISLDYPLCTGCTLRRMTQLQSWMEKHPSETDVTLAEKVTQAGAPISRVQINRIRRGESGASKATALALEKVTGITWHSFIGPDPDSETRTSSPSEAAASVTLR